MLSIFTYSIWADYHHSFRPCINRCFDFPLETMQPLCFTLIFDFIIHLLLCPGAL